jgi:hypothetical protein
VQIPATACQSARQSQQKNPSAKLAAQPIAAVCTTVNAIPVHHRLCNRSAGRKPQHSAGIKAHAGCMLLIASNASALDVLQETL